MGHTSITFGLLLGLTAAAAQLQPGLLETRSTPQRAGVAHADGNQDFALQDVTAAAVVESLRARFAGNDIEFKFDSFNSRQTSQLGMELRGAGQFRIEGGQAWLPIRYSALYDTVTGSIESPGITFATQSGHGRQASIDATMLDAMVSRQLTEEFASQAVEFNLGAVELVAGDARYAMIDGAGVASFAGEGAASVSVQAVYDRFTGQWLGVAYALGDDAA